MTDSSALPTCGMRRLLGMALLVACALQAFEMRYRGIDPDEFEHLHAAYMTWRGAVPYRDFFEHHGPLLYYVLRPLFWLFGSELTVLWFARLFLWFCSLGTLALTAWIARRLAGPPAGLVAATLLAWTTIFHTKGMELRPDVPATLLVTVCVALALEAPLTFRRWLTIGVLSGLATLFTQKSIVPIAGLTLAASLDAWCRGRSSRAAIIPLAMFAGGALAWAGALAAFAAAGAEREFFHGTVEQLLKWPVRSQRWDQLRPTLVAEPAVWLAGLVEIFVAWRRSRQEGAWQDGRLLVGITAAVSIGSLAWVKATYAQYYLLWFPLLAALAACRVVHWSRADVGKLKILVGCLAGSLLIVAQAALAWRALDLRANGALPHLSGLLQRTTSPPALVPVLVLLAAAAPLWWCARRRCWPAVAGIIAGLGMFHAILRDVDAAFWSNAEQVRRVNVLQRHVGPDEQVLDGYTGYGALRPHVYFFWWINEYSLALMTPTERETELLSRLQASPPAAVLFDRDLARLPNSVTDWIAARYEPLEDETWLWLPSAAGSR